jgi:hypothetical protein
MSRTSGTIADRAFRGRASSRPVAGARWLWAGVGLSLFGLGCGGADQLPTDESESVQAVLSIERLEHASQEETSSASAMAQFVVLPTEADAHATLDAAGLRAQLPERTGCVEALHADPNGRVAAAGLTFPEPLELLEAGDVSVDADGIVTLLALNVFPPSGSAAGVIYTTPDQSAQPLPPDTNYSIRATGSDGIPPLTIFGRAPGPLHDVTIAGIPLGHSASLRSGLPLDLTWAEGDAADKIYIELTDSERSIVCGFSDDDGAGTVPASFMGRLGSDAVIRLSVHRVREAVEERAMDAFGSAAREPFGSAATETVSLEAVSLQAMVRFDFELISLLRVE